MMALASVPLKLPPCPTCKLPLYQATVSGLAPALHWWLQHSDWTFRAQMHLAFRKSEVVGMAFVIVPVLLAILAGWALEQVESSRSPAA